MLWWIIIFILAIIFLVILLKLSLNKKIFDRFWYFLLDLLFLCVVFLSLLVILICLYKLQMFFSNNLLILNILYSDCIVFFACLLVIIVFLIVLNRFKISLEFLEILFLLFTMFLFVFIIFICLYKLWVLFLSVDSIFSFLYVIGLILLKSSLIMFIILCILEFCDIFLRFRSFLRISILWCILFFLVVVFLFLLVVFIFSYELWMFFLKGMQALEFFYFISIVLFVSLPFIFVILSILRFYKIYLKLQYFFEVLWLWVLSCFYLLVIFFCFFKLKLFIVNSTSVLFFLYNVCLLLAVILLIILIILNILKFHSVFIEFQGFIKVLCFRMLEFLITLAFLTFGFVLKMLYLEETSNIDFLIIFCIVLIISLLVPFLLLNILESYKIFPKFQTFIRIVLIWGIGLFLSLAVPICVYKMFMLFFTYCEDMYSKSKADARRKIGKILLREIPIEDYSEEIAIMSIRRKIKVLNDQRCVNIKDCFVRRVSIVIEYLRIFKIFSWDFWWFIGVIGGLFITACVFGFDYRSLEISYMNILEFLKNFIERIAALHIRLKKKFGVVCYVFIVIGSVFLFVFFLWFFLLL